MTEWEHTAHVWQVAFVPLAIILVLLMAAHAWNLSNRVVREPPVLGRRPNKNDPNALRATLARLRKLENRYTIQIAWNWFQVGLFGILLPIILFFAVCVYAASFFEIKPFVQSDGSRVPVNPTEQQLFWYVWDQTSDAITFGWAGAAQWLPASSVTHDASNIAVLAVVFLFRFIVNFFGVGWVIALFFGMAQAKLGRTKIQNRIDEHDLELLTAMKTQSNSSIPSEQSTISIAA